jgi:hypothetical protein
MTDPQTIQQQIDQLKAQLIAHRALTAVLFFEIAKSDNRGKTYIEKIGRELIALSDSWESTPIRAAFQDEIAEVLETALDRP